MDGTGGSIPAPAGEPATSGRPGPARAVYPRACGGTRSGRRWRDGWGGLSPRLRGNPIAAALLLPAERSIPAPAGEPCSPKAGLAGPQVYPRACGGTCCRRNQPVTVAGLSPRLRGNHRFPGHPRGRQRSIPAPAGEPRLNHQTGLPVSVYPRACGGTGNPMCDIGPVNGLSPRLRGNRRPTNQR